MTDYTLAVSRYESRNPILSLDLARELTGLDLVAAREEISPFEGVSYHQMEEESASLSHQSARDQGIDFFCSIGYRVFPEGIGVRGIYALSDFLAIHGNRTVFVEVLSDTNIKPETLQRKAQLQQYGELCFILLAGTKRSSEPNLLATKQLIKSWADVLYCRLDHRGNRIDRTYNATVVYDTTRNNGIRVALMFERSGRKLVVSARFLTHLYQNSVLPRAHPAYIVEPLSDCYAGIFLDVFKIFVRRTENKIKFTSKRSHVTSFLAMRRKSGLKMIGADGRVTACLKCHDILGVFVLEKTGPAGLHDLLAALREYGLTLQYSHAEFEQGLQLLTKQLTDYQKP